MAAGAGSLGSAAASSRPLRAAGRLPSPGRRLGLGLPPRPRPELPGRAP